MEKYDICVHFLLGKALQRVNQVSKSKLSPYGVTPVQYALLKMLWRKDGQFGFELAHKLRLDSATITGIIDRLETNRLVERRSDPNDRRNKLVFLTDNGRALELPLSEKMEEMNQEVLAGFSGEETLQFKKTLFDIGLNSRNKGS